MAFGGIVGTRLAAESLKKLATLKGRPDPDNDALTAVDTMSNVMAQSQTAKKGALEKAAKGPQPEMSITMTAEGPQVEYKGPLKNPLDEVKKAENDPFATYFEELIGTLKGSAGAAQGIPGAEGVESLTGEQMLQELGVAEPSYTIRGERGGLFNYLDSKKQRQQLLENPERLKQEVIARRLKAKTEALEPANKAYDQVQKIDADSRKRQFDNLKFKNDEEQARFNSMKGLFGLTDPARFPTYEAYKKAIEGFRSDGEFDEFEDAIAQAHYKSAVADQADKDLKKKFAIEDQDLQRRNTVVAEDRQRRLSEPKLKKSPTSNLYFSTVSPETLIARAMDPEYDQEGEMNNLMTAAAQWLERERENSAKYSAKAAEVRVLETEGKNPARVAVLKEEMKELQRKNAKLVADRRKLQDFTRGRSGPEPATSQSTGKVITDPAEALKLLRGGQ